MGADLLLLPLGPILCTWTGAMLGPQDQSALESSCGTIARWVAADRSRI